MAKTRKRQQRPPPRQPRRRRLSSLPINASLNGAGRTLWLSHAVYSRLGVLKARTGVTISRVLEALATAYLDGNLAVPYEACKISEKDLPKIEAPVPNGERPEGVEKFPAVKRQPRVPARAPAVRAQGNLPKTRAAAEKSKTPEAEK